MKNAILSVWTIVFLGACAAGNLYAAGGGAEKLAGPTPDKNILEVLKADGRFKVFLNSLADSGVEKTLSGADSYTVFAPTDEAFRTVSQLGELLGNTAWLKKVMNHHLIALRALDANALRDERWLTPVEGPDLKVEANETSIKINDAHIVDGNLKATNGCVHAIDRVLMKENDTWTRSASGDVEKDDDNWFRKTGGTIERGLKSGAGKIKRAFTGGSKDESQPEAEQPMEEEKAR